MHVWAVPRRHQSEPTVPEEEAQSTNESQKKKVTAIWVPKTKTTQKLTVAKPRKGGTEDLSQQIQNESRVQDIQTVSYAMMNAAGIILMRQDRKGLLMELVKLTVQIERTTAINALLFFPMRQYTRVKWTASNITVPQVVDQALQEQLQATGSTSQDGPKNKIFFFQMQTTQWSDPQKTDRIQ
jgi:hypothetical protein